MKNLPAPNFSPLFEKFLLCTLTIVSSIHLTVNIECIVASLYCPHNPTNQGAYASRVEILRISGRMFGNDNFGDLFEILQFLHFVWHFKQVLLHFLKHGPSKETGGRCERRRGA